MRWPLLVPLPLLRLWTACTIGSGAGFGLGLGLGLGFATALTPTTPTGSTATGAAAWGATTAGASATAAGAAVGVLTSAPGAATPVVVDAVAEEVRCTGAAWAGRANAATRPPEAARTAEALTPVSPALLTIVDSSATGL